MGSLKDLLIDYDTEPTPERAEVISQLGGDAWLKEWHDERAHMLMGAVDSAADTQPVAKRGVGYNPLKDPMNPRYIPPKAGLFDWYWQADNAINVLRMTIVLAIVVLVAAYAMLGV